MKIFHPRGRVKDGVRRLRKRAHGGRLGRKAQGAHPERRRSRYAMDVDTLEELAAARAGERVDDLDVCDLPDGLRDRPGFEE